jgi:hypothetical protein
MIKAFKLCAEKLTTTRPTVPKILFTAQVPFQNFDRSAILFPPFISHRERSETNHFDTTPYALIGKSA